METGWRKVGHDYGIKEKTETPPVSIEDRTVVGTIDRGLNSTNHMPEVGGSRNR